jgi:MFS family permease
VLHGVLNGAFYTATASLGQRLYPRARFAQFSSAGIMLLSVAQVVLAPLVGQMLDHTGHIYRHTYFIGFALAMLALFASFEVCRRIMRMGGFAAYRPPGDGPSV